MPFELFPNKDFVGVFPTSKRIGFFFSLLLLNREFDFKSTFIFLLSNKLGLSSTSFSSFLFRLNRVNFLLSFTSTYLAFSSILSVYSF